MKEGKHGREAFYIVGEGMRSLDRNGRALAWDAGAAEEAVQFRFSRMVPHLTGSPNSDALLAQLAVAMTSGDPGQPDPSMPAGYTYLGQFVDHDMTLDPSELDARTVAGALPPKSLRSPTLDLDSLYGDGPELASQFYRDDRVRLCTGMPIHVGSEEAAAQDGYDLPRLGDGDGRSAGEARKARIPDPRNDENLAVAQVHAALIRFHNRVVDLLEAQGVPGAVLFQRARETVTKHYQWMLRHDYLERIADRAVVADVFANGRRVFERDNPLLATMPVEFSGAAFRLGHSMIRESYEWNAIFNRGGIDTGHLFRLFRFCGTSGNLMPMPHPPGSDADIAHLEDPNAQPHADLSFPDVGKRLPSNWVADLLRLFDFGRFGAAFMPAPGDFNHAMRIDTHLVDPLRLLPAGSFGAASTPLLKKRNLAFRNLVRGRMLGLPSGQQLAAAFRALGIDAPTLDNAQLLHGDGGVRLDAADVPDRDELLRNAPLWFYALREAECNGGRLGAVGARIVAETFHRAMQASVHSIVADTAFKPTLGPGVAEQRFNMEDLLHFAFDGQPGALNPHLTVAAAPPAAKPAAIAEPA